jgi:arginine/ornithine N-succinyltransferase beta subunit
LYAALLPQAVQEALGQCAPAAEALRRALLDEGFQWREHVDIIDGGPVLERWPEGR